MLIGASGKIFFKKYVQDHSYKFHKYQIKITFPGKVLKKESIKNNKTLGNKVKLGRNSVELSIRHSMDQILFDKGQLMSSKTRGDY